MLKRETAILVVVDVQGKLARLMHDRDELFANLARIIAGCKLLEIPIIWVEQLPDKLGPTVPAVAELLADQKPITKASFSCCADPEFIRTLESAGRHQVMIAGIETHICVYQTAFDLTALGYDVQVVVDAVSSRTPVNKTIGLSKAQEAGARLTSVETALFEMLRVARGDLFRQMVKIVK